MNKSRNKSKWPGPPRMVDDQTEKRLRKPTGGYWCKMIYELALIMDSDEMVLLCFLLHHWEICSPDLPLQYRKTGWYWCMTATVHRYLGWDGVKQGRVLRKLKRRGYIEMEQHRKRTPEGLPKGQPVRWLRVDLEKIATDLDDANRASSMAEDA